MTLQDHSTGHRKRGHRRWNRHRSTSRAGGWLIPRSGCGEMSLMAYLSGQFQQNDKSGGNEE